MQQNQQGRRFPGVPDEPPVYRFAQNQPVPPAVPEPLPTQPAPEPIKLSRAEQRKLDKAHKKRRRRRFSLICNLLAVIGLFTVLIMTARYVVIPLLVYLKTLSGGAL